jgi:ribonuclease D
MTRRTSAAAYAQIEREGLLNKLQFKVYRVLYQCGPLTGRELNAEMRSTDGHKRLSELRDRCVIYEVRERACSVTGLKAIEWDVTDRLPCTPPNLKPPKPEAALRALDELEGLITETATREGLSESRISSEDTRELLRWVRWHFSRKLRAK